MVICKLTQESGMDLQRLKSFYYVAKLRNFTRAGEAVHRTQSTLSAQIKALEQELDCVLVDRIGKHSVALTAEGEALLDFARAVFQHYDVLEQRIAAIQHPGGESGGRIRVGAAASVVDMLLPPIIERFRALYPHMAFHLSTRAPAEVSEQVKNGFLDVGVGLESVVPSIFALYRWKRQHMTLITPQGHPLSAGPLPSLEDLFRQPLIVPSDTRFVTRQRYERAIAELDLPANIVVESDHVLTSVEYVRRGLGLGLLFMAEDVAALLAGQVDCRFLDLWFEPEYLCLYHRKNAVSNAAGLFIRFLLAGEGDVPV